MIPIHQTLDAAILKPEMSLQDVREALDLCIPYRPRTFCVRPSDLAVAKPVCREHSIGLCVVLGFPHGDQLPESKADEAGRYVDFGVDEIDMVANFGWVRSGRWDEVKADIEGVSSVTRPAGIPLKVIFESVHLTLDEVRKLVEICIEAGADFVKTSTGFNGEGASPDVVRCMVETAAGRIEVKPSGGIRNRETAEAYLKMGATRLGVGYTSVPAICGDGPESGAGY